MPDVAACVQTAPSPRVWLATDALLFVIVFALFFVCSQNEFAPLDDYLYVYKNAQVQQGLSFDNARWAWTTTEASNWHPLTWFSLLLDSTLYGPGPWGFHFTNIWMHALTAASLSLALRSLTGAAGKSWIVALLFSVHPLRVESVAWISERKDVLSVLFGVWTLLAYSRYSHSRTVGRWLLVGLAFVLSLLAKPMLVTLPAALLLLDFWPLRRTVGESWKRLVLEKVPFFGLSSISIWLTIHAQESGDAVRSSNHFPLPDRIANAVLSVATYLRQTLWPLDLCAYYPHPHWDWLAPTVQLSAGLLIAISAVALSLRHRAPYLLVGWLWFLGSLLPVLGIVVQQGSQGHADRFTYWPHLGLFVAAVWGLAALCTALRVPRLVPVMLLTIVVGAWSILTYQQIGLWKSTREVWSQAIAVTERNALALFGLAAWEQQMGNLGQAYSLYEQAWEADPRDAAPLVQLGSLSLIAGDTPRAIAYLEKARSISSLEPDVWLQLGEAYRSSGRMKDARDCLEHAIELKPKDGAAYCSMGVLVLDPANPQVALDWIEKGVALSPEYAPHRYLLGTTYVLAGRDAQAVPEFQKAVSLEREAVEAAEELGLALERLGRASEALSTLPQRLQTYPAERCSFLRAVIGINLVSGGRANEAADYFAEAIRLDQTWPRQKSQFAWTLLAGEKPTSWNLLRARQMANLLQQATPQNPDGYDLAAAVNAFEGRFDEAQGMSEKALQRSLDDPLKSRKIRQKLDLYRRKLTPAGVR